MHHHLFYYYYLSFCIYREIECKNYSSLQTPVISSLAVCNLKRLIKSTGRNYHNFRLFAKALNGRYQAMMLHWIITGLFYGKEQHFNFASMHVCMHACSSKSRSASGLVASGFIWVEASTAAWKLLSTTTMHASTYRYACMQASRKIYDCKKWAQAII